jgi:hypothetical protein
MMQYRGEERTTELPLHHPLSSKLASAHADLADCEAS